MDELDGKILDIVQREFPICERPYAEVAARLGISEDEAYRRIKSLRERGIVRRIGAVLDAGALGAKRALVACRVEPSRVEEVAGFVNRFDEVTHNYLREGADFNLWFTVVAADERRFERVVEGVAALVGSDNLLVLEAIRTFKIGAVFSAEAMRGGGDEAG